MTNPPYESLFQRRTIELQHHFGLIHKIVGAGNGKGKSKGGKGQGKGNAKGKDKGNGKDKGKDKFKG